MRYVFNKYLSQLLLGFLGGFRDFSQEIVMLGKGFVCKTRGHWFLTGCAEQRASNALIRSFTTEKVVPWCLAEQLVDLMSEEGKGCGEIFMTNERTTQIILWKGTVYNL